MFGLKKVYWFFLILMLVGMGVVFVPKTLVTVRSYFWKRTPCTILSNDMMESARTDKYSAMIFFRYRYDWNGITYQGARLATDREYATGSPGVIHKLAERYPKGGRTTCLVNPSHPAESALERGTLWPLLFMAGPFLIIGLIAHEEIIQHFQSRRRMRQMSRRVPVTEQDENLRLDPRLMFVTILCLTIGTFFTGFAVVHPLRQSLKAKQWKRCEATIVTSEVKVDSSQHGPTYSLNVSYKYDFRGEIYTSKQFAFEDAFAFSVAEIEDWVQRHPAGGLIDCWVNPQDPSEAVLDRVFHLSWISGLMSVGFSLSGVLVLAEGIQRPRIARNLRGKRLERFWRSTVPLEDPGSLLARYGAWLFAGTALGFVLAAGFAFVSLKAGLQGVFRMRFDLLHLLYGCFALGFAGWFIFHFWRFWKYWRGPRPILALNPPEPRVGQPFEVTWRLSNGQPATVSLALEGLEFARVREVVQGMHGNISDEKLRENLFTSNTIIQNSIERAGLARASTPTGSMHSFRGLKGGVLWRIKACIKTRRGNELVYVLPLRIRP
jgi:hypothetical protein